MNTIKKIAMFALALTLGTAFAAENDAVVVYSTKGPDTYADGSVVRNGECYALVWVKSGAAFAGINADGTAVDAAANAIVAITAIATNGCCPTVGFQIPADRATAYAGGTYSLCVLDTRGANGEVLGLDADGKVRAVNGWGLVEDASVSVTAGGLAMKSGASVQSATESEVPETTPQPQIKSFRVENGYAYITVAQTVSYLKYNVSRGETPDAIGVEAGDVKCGEAVQGDENGDVTIVVPVGEYVGFFRVGRG